MSVTLRETLSSFSLNPWIPTAYRKASWKRLNVWNRPVPNKSSPSEAKTCTEGAGLSEVAKSTRSAVTPSFNVLNNWTIWTPNPPDCINLRACMWQPQGVQIADFPRMYKFAASILSSEGLPAKLKWPSWSLISVWAITWLKLLSYVLKSAPTTPSPYIFIDLIAKKNVYTLAPWNLINMDNYAELPMRVTRLPSR